MNGNIEFYTNRVKKDFTGVREHLKFKVMWKTRNITKRMRILLETYRKQSGICHLCETRMIDPETEWHLADHYNIPTLDHVVPSKAGGKDDPTNYRVAHRLCNSIRGSTLIEKFDRSKHIAKLKKKEFNFYETSNI